MRYAFRHTTIRNTTLVNQCLEIISTYQAQGLTLTLRQLYYQLVVAGSITNEERSYKNLGNLVSKARLAGLMDWSAIEDRIRLPRKPSEWKSLRSLVDAALWGYRLPRREGQPHYLELWVEKDALAGVLQPIATREHVTLMVNRGYSSQSAMYEAGMRCKEQMDLGFHTVILYIGDHDPSGEDMVRDIQDRLDLFTEWRGEEGRDTEEDRERCTVLKLALTSQQVRQYDPPPNPAKMSDSRAAGYVAQHGSQSWEVDALPPQVLAQLVQDAIERHTEQWRIEDFLKQEKEDRQKLREAMNNANL